MGTAICCWAMSLGRRLSVFSLTRILLKLTYGKPLTSASALVSCSSVIRLLLIRYARIGSLAAAALVFSWASSAWLSRPFEISVSSTLACVSGNKIDIAAAYRGLNGEVFLVLPIWMGWVGSSALSFRKELKAESFLTSGKAGLILSTTGTLVRLEGALKTRPDRARAIKAAAAADKTISMISLRFIPRSLP